MERSVRKRDLLLLISWTKMISSMAWENPTAESAKEASATSATAQMIRSIQLHYRERQDDARIIF